MMMSFVAIIPLALLLWFKSESILAAKPYVRWSILVLFNALVSLGFVPLDSMTALNIAAILLAVLTFIPIYVTVENALARRSSDPARLKKSLTYAALIKGSLQGFPILHMASGVMAIAIVGSSVEALGYEDKAHIEDFSPVSFYFTTLVDGLILSAGVAVLALVLNITIKFCNQRKNRTP